MVEQFGLATIGPPSSASSFTPATTSGIPSARRKASDLSMQVVPASAVRGTSSELGPVPTEKKQRSSSADVSASGVASSTTSDRSPNRTSRPAERDEAKARTSVKPRSARSWSATVPTAPVAPTTPTLVMCTNGVRGVELERGVQRPDSILDAAAIDEAGDLDGRSAHDLGLDPEFREGRKRPARDARVRLHPRADDAHLAEVVARRPRDVEAVERRSGVLRVRGRPREDDLRPGLDDRVDADSGIRQRPEEPSGRDALDAVDRLLERVRDPGDDRLLEHPFVLLPDPGA